MGSIAQRDAAGRGVDQEAAQTAIRRARELYASALHSDDVTSTMGALRSHLRAAIPVCVRMAQEMPPESAPRKRLSAAVATAHQLLKDDHGHGQMACLVHMQLLADSTSVLYALLRKPR